MSNNEIMQFSYFYWKSIEKKADEKRTLFYDEICNDCWKNASWDTIRSSCGNLARSKRAATYRNPNKFEVLKSCKATVLTNDFELNILHKFCCS